MKAIAMMKKAIKDSELNGHKWTADKNGLHWSYLDTVFTLSIYPEGDSKIVKFKDENTDEQRYTVLVPQEDAWLVDSYHDFATDIDEAIYWAARKIIKRANYVY